MLELDAGFLSFSSALGKVPKSHKDPEPVYASAFTITATRNLLFLCFVGYKRNNILCLTVDLSSRVRFPLNIFRPRIIERVRKRLILMSRSQREKEKASRGLVVCLNQGFELMDGVCEGYQVAVTAAESGGGNGSGARGSVMLQAGGRREVMGF